MPATNGTSPDRLTGRTRPLLFGHVASPAEIGGEGEPRRLPDHVPGRVAAREIDVIARRAELAGRIDPDLGAAFEPVVGDAGANPAGRRLGSRDGRTATEARDG